MFRRFEIGDSDRLCIACPGAEHGEWNWLVVVVLDKSIPVLFHVKVHMHLLFEDGLPLTLCCAITVDPEHVSTKIKVITVFGATLDKFLPLFEIGKIPAGVLSENWCIEQHSAEYRRTCERSNLVAHILVERPSRTCNELVSRC